MTARQYLAQARLLDARIEARRERIERLRALAERATASCGAGPGGGGSSQDRRADIVAQIVDAQREMEADIADMLSLKSDIQARIDAIPDPRLRLLLELRYLNGQSWRAITREMHYSYSNLQRLHAAALKQFGERMEVETQ